MDQNQHGRPAEGTGAPEQGHGMNQCQSKHMMAPTPSPTQAAAAAALSASSSSYLRNQQFAHHRYIHQLQQRELQQQLNNFWANQYQEIEEITDFRNHSLPLARIKKIMKADEDVRMISAEAPVIFARACEMFILELTIRSWVNAEENKRRTLQKSDIAAAITKTDVFDFLVDIVPRDDMMMDHEVFAGIPRGGGGSAGASVENVSYYSMPPPNHVAGPPYGVPTVVMGRPVADQAHYGQKNHPFAGQMWSRRQNHSDT